tara:strand:+ start:9616 stop:9909 length:294 start_codon:yes stop_codon:yes gene_type:complete
MPSFERIKPTAIYSGQTNLSSSSTTVIGDSQDLVMSEVTIKAMVANAGSVYIGDSSVSTSTGFELRAGQQITISAGSPSLIYAIAAQNNDDISWVAT